MRVLAWPAFRNRKNNPYNFLLYSHLQKLGVTVMDLGDVVRNSRQMWHIFWQGVDILHIHWPEYGLGLPFPRMVFHMLTLFAGCLWHRSRGGKVVWTVHNLSPHENRYPFLERWFYRSLARMVDGLIFLSETSLTLFRKDRKMESFKGKPATVIPHGHYLPVYPVRVGKDESRRLLGLPPDSRVVLFFGTLRPYKGVEELVAVAKKLSSEGLLFLIAGKPISEEYKKRLLHMIGGSSHIRFHFEYIPDEKVPLYYSVADLVVLPYREILNSGTVFLALTFGVPVMVPRLGSLEELNQRYPRLVYAYDPPLTKEKIVQALQTIKLFGSEHEQEWTSYVRDLDWGKIAERTLEFYEALMEGNKCC